MPISTLPAWLTTVHNGQTRWQWLALVLCMLGVPLVAVVVFRVIWRWAGRLQAPWDAWLRILPPLLAAGMIGVVITVLDRDLRITGGVLTAVVTGGKRSCSCWSPGRSSCSARPWRRR